MKLYISNRQEILVGKLIDTLAESPPDPFIPEIILVQSKGMERWLRQELANQTGICSNIRFPFPNTAIRELFQAVLEILPDTSLFNPEYLSWRILKLLPDCMKTAAFQPVAAYMADDRSGRKRWQLAQRIALMYDNYQLYRPDMLADWESGKESDWQPMLWRKLVAETVDTHRSSLRQKFLDAIKAPGFSSSVLPERIAVFGIPYLPPFHFEVLAEVSRHIDIHLFFLTPSQANWPDAFIPAQSFPVLQTGELESQDMAITSPALPRGNSLLTSWGNLGAEFYWRAIEQKIPITKAADFSAPGQDTLLHCIQSDLFFNRNRHTKSVPNNAAFLSDRQEGILPNDRSIQFHACHSPMREIEVFHDHLLDLFERMPNLEPRDVLVMLPDIENYAPYIEAVFGTAPEGAHYIPYSVADRNPGSQNAIIRLFFKILDLKSTRFEATRILDVLQLPSVHRRFGLQTADLDLIMKWVKESGIRWGIDGADRKRYEVPPFDENSWEYGFRRMLLGFAMPGGEIEAFGGILPYDEIEGSSSAVLGHFLEFARELFDQVRALDKERKLADWGQAFRDMTVRMIHEDEDSRDDLEVLRRHFLALGDIQLKTGFAEPINLELVRDHLEQAVNSGEFSRSFLTGGVTFCGMLPMRSIPFRVVALLGMNHDKFPRSEHPLPFDRIAHSFRPGDRALRDEHRYLFLEALLSARDCLYLSYVGRSVKDNKEIPPSVLVSELIDYIQGRDEPAQEMVVRHGLQPFSRVYFLSGKNPADPLFSYSEENCQALTKMPDRRWWELPFLSKPLPTPEEEFRVIDLESLKRFFGDPVAYFFKRRLGIHLEDLEEEVEDCEPMAVQRLTEYGIQEELVSRILEHQEIETVSRAIGLKGVLPPEPLGRYHLNRLLVSAQILAARIEERISQRRLPDADIDLQFGPFQVGGRIIEIRESEMLRFRPASVKSKDFLAAWIDYLALRCQVRPDDPSRCLLLGAEKEKLEQWTIEGVEKPLHLFQELLTIYWRGLCEPLPLFQKSSKAYADAYHKGKSRVDALEAAANAWEHESHSGWAAERELPYHKLAFGRVNPINSSFESLAQAVWMPLLAHLHS